MNYENIGRADLNLLVAFHALIEERSITGASRRMRVSQPAMSRIVDRLQATFKDDLLVRTRDGYKPTQRAVAISEELQQLLPKLDALFGSYEFDPGTSTDLFRIEASDWGATGSSPG